MSISHFEKLLMPNRWIILDWASDDSTFQAHEFKHDNYCKGCRKDYKRRTIGLEFPVVAQVTKVGIYENSSKYGKNYDSIYITIKPVSQNHTYCVKLSNKWKLELANEEDVKVLYG